MGGAGVTPPALTVLAPIGSRYAKVRQGIHPLDGSQVHAAAEAAVAAVGTPERHELLAPETDAAAAAITGLYLQFGFVDEFHEGSTQLGAARANKKGAGLPYPLQCSPAYPP